MSRGLKFDKTRRKKLNENDNRNYRFFNEQSLDKFEIISRQVRDKGGFMGVEDGKSDQRNADWKEPETGKPAGKGDLIIGAKENPDGTLDYSRAASMKSDPEDVGNIRQLSAEKHREAFEVPPGYKPGSIDMVRFEVGKRILISEEALAKARADGRDEQTRRRFSQLQIFKRAEELLNDVVGKERWILSAADGSETMDDYIDSMETNENADKNDLLAARELRKMLEEEASKVQNTGV